MRRARIAVESGADAECYEVFASEACDDYLGRGDTIQDAKRVARDWAEDFMR